MRTNTVYANSYPQEVRAAIYCRLSKDDDLSGPSASIQNQRELLCSYCEEQGWRVAGIFQDDGYTGLNMDRPDFQRMLGAVERGMFDVILTKDLSRLGRNYLHCHHRIRRRLTKADRCLTMLLPHSTPRGLCSCRNQAASIISSILPQAL